MGYQFKRSLQYVHMNMNKNGLKLSTNNNVFMLARRRLPSIRWNVERKNFVIYFKDEENTTQEVRISGRKLVKVSEKKVVRISGYASEKVKEEIKVQAGDIMWDEVFRFLVINNEVLKNVVQRKVAQPNKKFDVVYLEVRKFRGAGDRVRNGVGGNDGESESGRRNEKIELAKHNRMVALVKGRLDWFIEAESVLNPKRSRKDLINDFNSFKIGK